MIASTITLVDLIAPFIGAVADGRIEVYNEFSLQHELGVFLRGSLPNYKVQFERNVNFFFREKARFTKKEMDVSVFSPDKSELKCAIELKYPRNGQCPEQMFCFCKDIAFAEELSSAGFVTTAVIIFAEDRLFYQGKEDGIYGFFRGSKPIHGRIQKPTGKKDDEVTVRGHYSVELQPISGSLKYTIIEVSSGNK